MGGREGANALAIILTKMAAGDVKAAKDQDLQTKFHGTSTDVFL
jgi:hypothetical protein